MVCVPGKWSFATFSVQRRWLLECIHRLKHAHPLLAPASNQSPHGALQGGLLGQSPHCHPIPGGASRTNLMVMVVTTSTGFP